MYKAHYILFCVSYYAAYYYGQRLNKREPSGLFLAGPYKSYILNISCVIMKIKNASNTSVYFSLDVFCLFARKHITLQGWNDQNALLSLGRLTPHIMSVWWENKLACDRSPRWRRFKHTILWLITSFYFWCVAIMHFCIIKSYHVQNDQNKRSLLFNHIKRSKPSFLN